MLQSVEMDDRWREALIHQIDPRARDIVLDVGCGAGEFAVMLKLGNPAASVFGLDARPSLLDSAERRAYTADARVNFVHATFDDAHEKLAAQSPTQIVCSRVFGHLTFHRQRALLAAMFAALPRGGILHIADTGRHGFSRLLARSPWARATEFRDDVLNQIRTAGFKDCAIAGDAPVGNRHIHFFRGVKP